jgi:O-6-methylguanine DNA methyltransferase
MERRSIKRILERKGLTNFQVRVLLATYSIPQGRTATYKEIAKRAGYPNAYRAVGSVMRVNPLAPTIPCHRVIRSDGSLGNYSNGGTKTKMLMLKREHAI